MSDQNGTTSAGDAAHDQPALDKGKGKAVDPMPAADVSMGEEEDDDEDDSSGDELSGGEQDAEIGQAEDEDEDNMEEIDLDNIVDGGRRTRGKNIDFAKAAQEGGDDEDDDEEDDEDYNDPDDEMHD